MYKILALDLDDTLLNSNKEVSEKNLEAINEAKKLGVKIVIATGRPIIGAMPYVKILGLENTDTYVLCFNGGLIYSLKEHKYIKENYMRGLDVKLLYKEALRLDSNFHLYNKSQELYSRRPNPYTDFAAKINKVEVKHLDIEKLKDDDEILKCMFVDSKEKLDDTIKNLDQNLLANYTSFRSQPVFFEVLNKEVSKGKALIWLANFLGYDKKEVIACGDSENDLSMIKMAGLGVAMENAQQEIKKEANFITKSNNEDGISYVIHKFILRTE